MSPNANNRFALPVAAAAFLVFLLAGWLGGPGLPFDVGLIQSLAASRAAHPELTSLVIPLTNAGGALGMIAILVIVVGMLMFRGRWRMAAVFGGIVLGGRLVVELLKLLVDRPRPSFDAHPVAVSSLSFPSAHSANSMITFLAIALLLVPARYRTAAIPAALALSGVVGATRPYLGVHWPSDVIGGWAFGIAWVVTLAKASHYWRASDAPRAI
ncbi:MAG: phosphatase PAP2 family protein [Sphingomicrobium sp.]